MAKRHKLLAIFIAVALLFDLLVLGFYNAADVAENDTAEQFRSELTSIYSLYDTDISKVDMSNEFALKRLIVSDYDGDDCGAVAKAVDNKNNFAVLQFKTPEQAESAYNKLKARGLIVDADGISEVQAYNKGEMHPTGSNAVGTTSFINKCAMDTDDIVVAVIDTGIMLSHPDFEGRFVNDGYDYSQDGLSNADYDTELQPHYYHGTSVCGIIANNTMDNVKILPYKVVPFGQTATTDSAVISAINNAVDMGVDVINLSYISAFSAASYRRAVQNAYRNNVCICVSAGNGSSSCDNIYPACIPESFTVAALNSGLTANASYSNYGQMVDFCAPGTKIYSATPLENGEAGYDNCSGTSFSAPYIAALCANIKSVNSQLSNDRVYDILCDFCVDYGDEGFDRYYGNGMPTIGNITYSQSGVYDYAIPEGVLNVYSTVECSADNQPWCDFAQQIKYVNVLSVGEIGAYSFSDMKNAEFSFNTSINYVGEYAFKGCEKLNEITFDDSIEYIGEGAFDDIPNLVINGYMNTPAYEYALANNIRFNSIGCKHAYIIDIYEPSGGNAGYTRYECRVCGDYYIGEYLPTAVTGSGVCGDNLTYKLYSTGKLTIMGTGDMYDYSDSPAPWYDSADSINIVQIDQGVSSVSPFAFYGCTNLIEFRNSSSEFTTINKSLYDFDGRRLICAVNEYGDIYTMPDTVVDFDATAFLATKPVNVVTNSNFTLNSSLIYDQQGNIVVALSNYRNTLLSINDSTNIRDYAFILTEYPNNIRIYSTTTVLGEYSVGYYYDNGFVKEELNYYGYVDAPAYQYAVDNEFNTNPLNAGSCGDELSWYYNIDDKKLIISGTGNMTVYAKRTLIPWYDYLESVEEVVIGDDVSSLSQYSFYNASSLRKLTLPASLNAPVNGYVWSGTDSIEELNITCGTGIMPNYGTSISSRVYTYSPWYISRESIQSFNLSPDIVSIGSFAFRNCLCISSVVLNNCSIISKYAFYDCSNLESFTVYSKDTIFASESIFSYSSNDMKNENATLYAYSDSIAKDYSVKQALNFVSLGCGHTRGNNSVSDYPSCCYNATVSYSCKDCNAFMYSEYLTAESDGHYVKGVLQNTKGKFIPDAEVYFDGVLAAITNEYGKFVIDGVKCEIEHNVVIKKHGYTVAETVVNTNKRNRTGGISIRYGNFIPDSAVNGKDYAYARFQGYEDLDLIDFGKLTGEKTAINTAYNSQPVPRVINTYVEQNAEVNYRKDFYFDMANTADYTVTEVGVLYGKNMPDSFMTIENVGKKNQSGLALKSNVYEKVSRTYYLAYGASSSTGVLSARLYIKYTNGVRSYINYSDIQKYEY